MIAVAEEPVRVLVVDDDADTVETTTVLLHMTGYETRTATGGAEAIELAKAFHPEIVLLDLCMPKMDGYAVAREFAQHRWQ